MIVAMTEAEALRELLGIAAHELVLCKQQHCRRPPAEIIAALQRAAGGANAAETLQSCRKDRQRLTGLVGVATKR